MLFGQRPLRYGLLKLLNLSSSDFGRFRDAYVTENHIVVHTRCGGGNRESYEDVFDQMQDHPLFDYDEDNDYDCTYCNFYFKHPVAASEFLKELSVGTVTPSEKWKILFEQLEAK